MRVTGIYSGYWRRRLVASAWVFATAGLGAAQLTVPVSQVQQDLNAAIVAGASTFVLPDATILVDKTLDVPPRARNLTIIGQPRTRLVLATTNLIPLLRVGVGGEAAFSNDALTATFTTSYVPSPVLSDGASVLQLPSGQTTVPGWYVIAGMSTAVTNVTTCQASQPHVVGDDAVRNGASIFHFKRELVRVVSQNGTAVVLSAPLGREFENPRLFLVEPDSATPENRRVPQNIRLINFAVDGRLGDRVVGRTPVTKSPQVPFAVEVNRSHNVTFDNVRVSGFSNSGIKFALCRNANVINSQISDGNTVLRGYGIEFAATRFGYVANTTFQDLRWGAMFQSGSMDCYVYNCSIPPGRGGFDVGHGQDERRITYENCRADTFVIGNQTWLRGGRNASMITCSAYRQIIVYGATRNVLIEGKHPNMSFTAPSIAFSTDENRPRTTTGPSGQQGCNPGSFPAGPVGPISATLNGVTLNNNVFPGVPLRIFSGSATNNFRSNIGQITVINSMLINSVFNGEGIVLFPDVLLANPNSTGPARATFQNCQFITTASNRAALEGLSVTSGSSWDVTVQSSIFSGPTNRILELRNGARGTYSVQSSTLNSNPITTAMAVNNSGGSASVQIAP